MKSIRSNSWLAALAAWVGATFIITVAYVTYSSLRGLPIDWIIIRNGAGIALLLAAINGFRDRNRKDND